MPIDSNDLLLAIELCRTLDLHGGTEISLLDVSTISSYTDLLILASGRSQTVVKALAEYTEVYADKHRISIVGIEGRDAPDWIVVDLGHIVVHLFTADARGYYNLDKLWMDAQSIPIPAPSAS